MKSLRLFWLGTLLLVCLTATAQLSPTQRTAAQFSWARAAFYPTGGPSHGTYFVGLSATDATGNTYTWFAYRTSFELDDSLYVAPDTLARMGLVKLNPAGHVEWLKQLGTDSGRVEARSIATDAAGNVYVAGRMLLRKFWLDGQLLDAQSGGATFLAKWAPNGDPQFAQIVARGSDQYTDQLTIDPTGNIYLAGTYHAYLQLGTIRLDQANYHNGRGNSSFTSFVAKLNPAGVAQWAHTLDDRDSLSLSFAGGVGFDAAGNTYYFGIYCAGSGIGSFTFPTAPAPTGDTREPRYFWVKIDAAGTVVRARTFNHSSNGHGGQMNLEVNPVTGYSYGGITISTPVELEPGLTVTPQGDDDAVVFCLDPNGVVQWTRNIGGTGPHDRFMSYDLSLDAHGRVYVTGQYRGTVVGPDLPIPPADTAATAAYQIWAAALDQKDGQAYWAVGGDGGGVSGAYAYRINPAPSGAIITVMTTSDSVRLGGLLFATQPGNFSYKLLTARITQQYNTLGGAAYRDLNANGQQDAAEGGFPGGLVVEVNPGNLAVAAPEATGHYDAYVELSNYTASLPNPPAHYTVVPHGPAATAFSTFGNVGAGRSFALQPIANRQDVQIFLTQISANRAGYPVTYDVEYRNVGTVALPTGTVTLAADPRLAYVGATTAPTTTTGATRAWTYVNLLPGEGRRIRVSFTLPPTTPLGDTITSAATVTPLAGDLTVADNAATTRRVVTGSLDPNDIEVNHVRLSTSQVQNGEWLEYTIRFQNHGTDTAFSVLVRDTLPVSQLQMSTIQPLAFSHTCRWGFNAAGLVVFDFADIRLPAQLTNPFESDGAVRFRIRPRTTLAAGDIVPNRAAIHFDFNPPMTTNTALTTVLNVTGRPETPTGAAVQVWPNPASGTLHVEVPTVGVLTLTLLDALGRPVLTQPVPASAAGRCRATLDLAGLPAGLYVLRGQGAAEFARRVVVR